MRSLCWLLLLFVAGLPAQVLLIEGDGAFVVRPGSTVELRVVVSAASLGGNVGQVNVRFMAPAGQGSFGGRQSLTVATDAAGRATASFTAPDRAGYFSADAVAEVGDGAVASFAFSVGNYQPVGTVAGVKAEVRRVLLRNAADGSNLQLVGPYWLEPGMLVRPARWGKEKEAGGLWRAEQGSWLFWVDDGPAKSWAKPTRYYLVPGTDVSRTRIAGEQWWPWIGMGDGAWHSVGRATSFESGLLPIAGVPPPTGEQCAVVLAATGQAGAQVTVASFEAYARRIGVTRFFSDAALATGCSRTHVLISAMGDRDGIWLERWTRWGELAERFRNVGELVVFAESNQSGLVAKYWSGYGVSGVVVSSTDDLRIGYMQPLRGGYVARGLIPALERLNGNLEAAVADTLRGELTVSSARPQLQRIEPGGPRRMEWEDVEFSNLGGWKWMPLPRALTQVSVNVSDPQVASAFVNGDGVMVRGLAEGRATLLVTGFEGNTVWNGVGAIRVGLGVPTLRACLAVVGQSRCLGQMQRNIPVAEDEVGGHAFVEVQDETVASVEQRLYTYNRGERNVPLTLRGLKAGRTWVRFRSHDGNVMSELPVQVAEPPVAIGGLTPTACPDAATYRATFVVSGGDTSLFTPFGGEWWGSGITLVFRKTAPDRFEIRSSGAPEGQFFAMAGTLAADCSFIGSGQGVAGLRVTTAQVRGRIVPRTGVFDTMTLDYSIGVDGVFGGAIDYRGTATLVAGCGYRIEPGESVTAEGGLFPVRVASPALCPWTAAVSVGVGEVVIGQLGFGPGVFWLQVPANAGPERRIRLSVAGQLVELTQAGRIENAPQIQIALSAGRFDSVVGQGAPLMLFGNGLSRPVRVAADVASLLYLHPAYVVAQVPQAARFGVAAITSGASAAAHVFLERSAPAVFVESGVVYVAGIDPALPVLVEIGGVERSARLQLARPGLYQLEVDGPLRGEVRVRQGGRVSQRGALVM